MLSYLINIFHASSFRAMSEPIIYVSLHNGALCFNFISADLQRPLITSVFDQIVIVIITSTTNYRKGIMHINVIFFFSPISLGMI